MAEQATRIKDQGAGDYIATRDANELDNEGHARTVQLIDQASRQLLSPSTLRGSTPVAIADGVDLYNLPVDLTNNLITVGDKKTLIVNSMHKVSDGGVHITPIVFNPAGDNALAIQETMESSMTSILFSGIGGDCGLWVQKAPQLDTEQVIHALVVLNDKLYGGTGVGGRLFEWNGTDTWVGVAPQLEGQNRIEALAVLNGKIYGGTSIGGRLFEWNGTNAWVQVAPQLEGQDYVYSLAVFNGKIYGGTGNGGRLFEWNGSDAWVQVAPQLNSEQKIYALAVFNGKLYGGTAYNGLLFEWNGTDAWVQVAPTVGDVVYALAVLGGKLYGTGWGKLQEWNGTDAWVEVADNLNGQNYTWCLIPYNSCLYAGTGNLGRLFKWNGTNAWIEVSAQVESQTYIYSLAVFNGKLYGGTGTLGNLFEATQTQEQVYNSKQLKWDVSGAPKIGLHITSIEGVGNEVTLKGGII